MPVSFHLPRRRAVVLFVLAASFLAAMLTNTPANVQAKSSGQAAVRIPVMMYHYISVPPDNSDHYREGLSVIPALFDQQMQWLHTHGYKTVSADQVAQALTKNTPLPAHSVLLTFDDGYEDAYTNAFPILKKYGLIGTFFVVTDWIDQGRSGYLTWAQVKEMAAAGMSIEAHSRTHVVLVISDRTTTLPWLSDEIAGSIADIQIHLGVRPTLFAYPYGRFDKNTIKLLKAAGISAAFTTSHGVASTYLPLLLEPRVRVQGGETAAEFAAEVLWAGV